MLIVDIFSTLRYNTPKNENSFIIYSPAVSSKPVRISFFCRNQNKIFYWNILVPTDFQLIFSSIQWMSVRSV